MTHSTLHALSQPVTDVADSLHELLRQGARDLIAKAVEAEWVGFPAGYDEERLDDGRKASERS